MGNQSINPNDFNHIEKNWKKIGKKLERKAEKSKNKKFIE